MRNRKTTIKRRKRVRNRKRRKGRSRRHEWFKKKNRGGVTRKDLRYAKKQDKKYNPRTSIRTAVRQKRKQYNPRTSIRTTVRRKRNAKKARLPVVELEELVIRRPRSPRRETIIPQNFWRISYDSENPLRGLSPSPSIYDSPNYALSDMSLPSANYSQ